jgi:hypothetical protein
MPVQYVTVFMNDRCKQFHYFGDSKLFNLEVNKNLVRLLEIIFNIETAVGDKKHPVLNFETGQNFSLGQIFKLKLR